MMVDLFFAGHCLGKLALLEEGGNYIVSHPQKIIVSLNLLALLVWCGSIDLLELRKK